MEATRCITSAWDTWSRLLVLECRLLVGIRWAGWPVVRRSARGAARCCCAKSSRPRCGRPVAVGRPVSCARAGQPASEGCSDTVRTLCAREHSDVDDAGSKDDAAVAARVLAITTTAFGHERPARKRGSPRQMSNSEETCSEPNRRRVNIDRAEFGALIWPPTARYAESRRAPCVPGW
jgi:hypothetical protein